MSSGLWRALLSVGFVLAGCDDAGRRYTSPTAPEPPSSATPQPTPTSAPPSLEGLWSGTVTLEEVSDPRGYPRDDCVSAALRSRFAGSFAVELVIDSSRFHFARVPAIFGACEGGYGPLMVGDWDIWCDFHVPFEIFCEDGDPLTLYFPNFEDDLGFEIVRRSDDAITFPFTAVFLPSFDAPRANPLYHVTFRFELRR